MNTNSESRGIFQRLIKFVLSVVSRPNEPRGSSEVLIEEGSPRNVKSFSRPINMPNGFSGSEIVIEFKHSDGSKRWAQVDQPEASIRRLDEKDKNRDHFDPIIDSKTGIRQKKSVTFKEADHHAGNEEMQANTQLPHEDTMKARPTKKLGPLLTVASNINEKAETFIQSRKKAMNRSHSLDQHEKS